MSRYKAEWAARLSSFTNVAMGQISRHLPVRQRFNIRVALERDVSRVVFLDLDPGSARHLGINLITWEMVHANRTEAEIITAVGLMSQWTKESITAESQS